MNEKVEKKKVLVFDDDKRVLNLLNSILKKKFDVTSIADTSTLLIQAEVQNPQLILLDLNMPNIDGFEVLNILSGHPATSNTPVVCISADATSETRKRVRDAGACGFLKKPFKMETLIDDLEALVGSLNKTTVSADKRKQFTITYNEKEKYRLIHNHIHEQKDSEDTLVFLSWVEASDFLTAQEKEMVDSGKLIFLQIKPSLIIKFPFLQEVSPIFQDLNSLLDDPDKTTHIIFDELRNIVNVYDSERSLAKAYSLSTFFKNSYKKVSFFNTKPANQDSTLLLEKMAKIFVGSEN